MVIAVIKVFTVGLSVGFTFVVVITRDLKLIVIVKVFVRVGQIFFTIRDLFGHY